MTRMVASLDLAPPGRAMHAWARMTRAVHSMKRRRLRKCALWLLGGLLIFPCVVASQERASLQTVARVDLDRYVGTWYEVARLPNRFQDQCSSDVTAVYRRLDDGTIEVVNRCRDKSGMLDEARGVARVVDPASNAKLEVSFVSVFGYHLFWGDYWILGLGEDYEYALVGMPSRKYGWILSRTTRLPDDAWDHLRHLLIDAGYDPDRFMQTRHGELPGNK